MSEAVPNKRRKFDGSNKKKRFVNYQKKSRYLEPGFRGFMITCNFREKDCVRESYTILNEYADTCGNLEDATQVVNSAEQNQDIIPAANSENSSDDKNEKPENDSDSETEDISSQLDNEIQDSIKAKAHTERRFQQVDTSTPNCLFIKTTLRNPVGLAEKILRDLAATKIQKTRFLLRLIPIETVSRANIDDIKLAAGKLFDKHFLNTTPQTFSIVVNKRYNNNIDRMEIIRELADIITFKNAAHKVDLRDPRLTVIVEVIKGLCCLSVVPDYLQLKKYNLIELAAKPKESKNGNNEKVAETKVETVSDDKNEEDPPGEPSLAAKETE